MKKLFLLFLCTCTSLSYSFGQTSKGTKFWVVDFGIYGNKNDKTFANNAPTPAMAFSEGKYLSFTIGASFGKFLKNNLSHGIGIRYFTDNYSKNESTLSNNARLYESYSKNIQLDYYLAQFIPIDTRLFFYGELNPNLAYSVFKSVYDNDAGYRNTRSSLGVNLNVGVRYMFKNNFFINGKTSLGYINYSWQEYNGLSVNNSESFSTSSGFSIYNNSLFSSLNLGVGKTF